MSSPPNITVAAVDIDVLYRWRVVIYRKIEKILLEECVINIELLREWREFFFKIAFEIMHMKVK